MLKTIRHKFWIALGLLTLVCFVCGSLAELPEQAKAVSCADIHIIFARGSGEQLNDTSYQNFKNELTPYLDGINYQFYELGSSNLYGDPYNAVAVGIDSAEQIGNALGAKISGGNSYNFGAAVNRGVNELKNYVVKTSASCPNSKFVLAGYSQGAMVISKAIQSLSANKIIAAATIADPKLYLPEGAGSSPMACSDSNSYSSYRTYVPDCYAYQGILGGYKPYLPDSSYTGKLASWCNYHDLICSSRIDWNNLIGAHTSYISDGRYADVAKLLANKIYNALMQNQAAGGSESTRDVAILIDSTGSMRALIDRYKNEALQLATRVLAAGGRVALYEYRDLADPFTPVQLCDFDSCNLEVIDSALQNLVTDNGGDDKESLLSASLLALNSLKWQVGANKSIVVLTDAGFHSPDRDGVTLSQVIQRSLEIDPVHFFIITSSPWDSSLQELAAQTGGQVFDSNAKLEDSTTQIVGQSPENLAFDDGRDTEETATISNLQYQQVGESLQVQFSTNAYRSLIIINDNIIGFSDQNELEIQDLDFSLDNYITIIPYSASGIRGESISIELPVAPSNSTIGVPASGFFKKQP